MTLYPHSNLMQRTISFSLLVSAAVFLAGSALGQTVLRTYVGVGGPGPDYFGSSVCALGDVNFDGVADYAIGAPSAVGGSEVHVYSGQTGLELYQAIGGAGVNQIGWQLTNMGDVNNDGAADFASSAREYSPCGCPLAVRIFSGVDGAPLFDVFGETIYDSNNDDGFGASIAGVGDTNGDGTPDLAVTASTQINANSVGKIFLFSGVDGSLLWSAETGTARGFSYDDVLQPVGDMNGDGYADFSTTYRPTSLWGGWRVYSGIDGAILHDVSGIQGRSIDQVVPLGSDMDGDGLDDYIVRGTPGGNNVYLAIASLSDLLTPHVEVGYPVFPTAYFDIADCQKDLSGDGIPDVVIHSEWLVDIYSGADLHRVQRIPGVASSQYNVRVDRTVVIDDVNFDGQADLLIGAIVGQQITDGAAKVVSGGDRIGTEYCTNATPNSTGQAGSIYAIGFNGPGTLHKWLSLQVQNLPPGQFGLFLAAMGTNFVPNPGGSLGNLCLGGAIGRFNTASQLQISDPGGQAGLEIDLNAIPQPTGSVILQSGQTWNFQMWHRDIGGTSNFTNAVSTVWY